MASVSLRGVSKAYGNFHAVRMLDLDVKEGEFLVLLGPSGCGKTTTLRMVAGFAQPTTGQILIGGADVTNLPPRLRNIGMVFQNYALFPNMTVAENIGFGLRERHVPTTEAERRVEELLTMVQLSARSNAYISELSGGQQQRVALARALAFHPKLLLMDEPLGALDLKLREAMQVELHRIQRSLGITTIMVTHDQQEAMSLADRIVVMADGEIEQLGTPEALYTEPRTRFVAGFIGKNNLLRGEVVGTTENGGVVRIADAFDVEVPARCPPRVGETVDVSVRPEHLHLAHAPPSHLNRIKGRVEARRFLGNVIYYSIRLPDQALLLVEGGMNEPLAAEGDGVDLVWEPAKGILFGGENRAAADAEPGAAFPDEGPL